MSSFPGFGCEARALGRTVRASLVLLVIILTLSTGAKLLHSQESQEPGRVDGKVCAASGEPIAGALVTLVGKASGRKIGTKTNVDGTFVLLESGEGMYTLHAEKAGWKPAVVDSLHLTAGEKRHMSIVLESLLGSAAASRNEENVEGADLKFSDEPNFAVAGVTDWSSAGLHGSAANARTSEDLAKETAALKSTPKAAKSTSTGDADAHRELGDTKEKSGDPIGAVNEYEKAARMDPSEENYFAWGTELLLHRAAGAAIEVFSKGAKDHANSARMLAGLGAAYYANGQYVEAARRVCEASDLQPLDTEPYLLLGKMEKAAAEPFSCSEEKLARFAQEQPRNAQANYYYGLVLWKEARKSQSGAMLEQAEALFKKAATIDPAFGEAYLQLGLVIAARGDFEEALRRYEQAIQANPKLGVAHYQLSLAYRRVGEIAKAEHELQVYKEIERAEAAEAENERRELRQFVTILKDAPAASNPH
jgi:tetratricopeptide (TPR) repeat protein